MNEWRSFPKAENLRHVVTELLQYNLDKLIMASPGGLKYQHTDVRKVHLFVNMYTTS